MMPRRLTHLVLFASPIALTLLLLAPSAVAADEDMEWQFSEFNDPKTRDA